MLGDVKSVRQKNDTTLCLINDRKDLHEGVQVEVLDPRRGYASVAIDRGVVVARAHHHHLEEESVVVDLPEVVVAVVLGHLPGPTAVPLGPKVL